tara:strand:+ start:155 stop:709 length:555 start_codon:yes stop_codon:yes gene_type:complete
MVAQLKWIITSFCLAIVCVVAQAEPLPPAVIAIIDYRALELESDAALDVIRQVNSYRDKYQAEIVEHEDALRSEAQELERQQTILAPEVFKEKRLSFEQRTQTFQQEVMERNRRFDRALGNARNEILRTVLVIVTKIAEDRKFNIVLDNSQALFVATALDITAQVMEELNEKLPTVAVKLPPEQ